MTDYEALFAKADADLKDANERYSQAAVDSMDAAFRGLVFGCAAEGVSEIRLEPSDQGDYMSIVFLLDADGDEHGEGLDEDLWNYASDLTDYPDAPWRILAGVTNPTLRGDYTVTIDVKVAAEGLLDDSEEPDGADVERWQTTTPPEVYLTEDEN